MKYYIYILGTVQLPQINNIRGLKNFKPPILYDRKKNRIRLNFRIIIIYDNFRYPDPRET